MATKELKISTTGTLSPVIIADLGNRSFIHPTVDFDLLTEYSLDELFSSTDLASVINNGYLTIKNEDDVAIDEVNEFPSYNVKNNLTATSDPTTSDDKTEGYSFGSNWVNTNTNETFLCLDNTEDAAVWITPVTLSLDKSFCFDAARNFTASNIYLCSGNGTPTNVSPFILPFNSTIIAISASSDGAETWTAEVRKSGTLISGASLSISAAASAYDDSYNINVDQGDGLQFYCNGTSITRPRMTVWLKRR